MDTVTELRIVAHTRSARLFETRAEFFGGLERLFAEAGDDAQAKAAREAAERERLCAADEWKHVRR